MLLLLGLMLATGDDHLLHTLINLYVGHGTVEHRPGELLVRILERLLNWIAILGKPPALLVIAVIFRSLHI